VQFGLDPSRGIVLDGLSEAEIGWLLTLRPAGLPASVHSAGVLLGSATPWGVTASRAAELVGRLGRHGLLEEPQPGARGRTRQAPVCVLGSGSAASDVRAHLHALTSAGRSVAVHLVEDPDEAEVTVLVVAEALGAQQALDWAGFSAAHIPVVVQAHRVVVGPLVTESGGPCLTCLDHYRRGRDRAWPVLMSQVEGALTDLRSPVHVDPVLSGVTAGVCTMVVHAFLTTGAVPFGLTWEVSTPWPRVLARRWARHPACRHHPPPGAT